MVGHPEKSKKGSEPIGQNGVKQPSCFVLWQKSRFCNNTQNMTC
ncbi:MAG: DUF620 domain-containing protein [Acetobacter sp.]|nr:DUF620 domain-containing protein [Acetobacter sp.]